VHSAYPSYVWYEISKTLQELDSLSGLYRNANTTQVSLAYSIHVELRENSVC
jgi:hypothetical protein